ncbi:MAG: hypothetical protein HFG71_01645 [Hungatella sp.]|nr:hypothetical protein [Hungatella sp.]
MSRNIFNSNIVKYVLCGMLSIAFFVLFFRLWEFDITKPYFFQGRDDFFYNVVAKNAMDGGTYFYNPNLGAPYGMELYYFPLLMQSFILWCKFVGIFTNNWIIAINLYYFLTYILSVCTFFYMCKRAGVKNNQISYLGGLIFSFSQYHMYRMTIHITATSYFIIPLIMVLCLNMSIGKYESVLSKKEILEVIIICILAGCTDIYYAFFGCFLLCVMLVDSIIKKHWRTLVAGITMIGGIVLIVLLCLYPSIIYTLKNGINEYAAARSFYEAYLYGFQIVSLFLPLEKSQGLLSKFTEIYKKIPELPSGEQICNYAGIIGIIGVVYTTYYVLFKKDKDGKQDLFVRLNLAIVLLGTVGGIGLITAIFIISKIRTYTRVFPYVFACLIMVVCILFDDIYRKNKRWFLLLVILVSIHFIDLSPWSLLPDHKSIEERYDEEKTFITNMEDFVEDGDYILQLPYLTGLENESKAGGGNCNFHFKGYLLSTKNLGWSYGTLVGTEADNAYKEKFDTDSIEQILFFAKRLGYSGIYIDTSILDESEKHIVQDLEEKLGYISLISKNRKMVYFDIRNHLSKEEYLRPIIVYSDGFYEQEIYKDFTWRWSKPESIIKIYNLNAGSGIESVEAEIELHSFTEKMKLTIQSGNYMESFDITNDTQTITIPVDFYDGEVELRFFGDSMEYENGTVGRELSFRINDVIIQ